MDLTKEEKQTFRTLLFKHQDGIAVSSILLRLTYLIQLERAGISSKISKIIILKLI